MDITDKISDKILVDLGVKEAEPEVVIQVETVKPRYKGANRATVDAENKSAEIWAAWMGANLRKTSVATDHPVTDRHLVPVTEGKWTKDEVLKDLDDMRKECVTFHSNPVSSTATIQKKDMDMMVEIITSDMLNAIEQAGFVVNSYEKINMLHQVMLVWLTAHTNQYHNGRYFDIVVQE